MRDRLLTIASTTCRTRLSPGSWFPWFRHHLALTASVRLRAGAGRAKDQAEPARFGLAADCRHDDRDRVQPPGRARTRALRRPGPVRQSVVPMRGRCDDDRGQHGDQDRRSRSRGGEVFGLERAERGELDRHLQQAVERVAQPLPRGSGRASVRGPDTDGVAHGNAGVLFPMVDGKKAELVIHWGTTVVPMTVEVP